MKTKILKSISNNSNNNSNWAENPSFIFSDLCYCGHNEIEMDVEQFNKISIFVYRNYISILKAGCH